MAFDFTSYLAKLDPTQSYNIQTLTGGVVNITARASRVLECEASLSRFPGHSSFILKHAPPYIAGIGPEAPFSTFRQTVEARALSLFLPSSNSLYHLCEESGVKVPILLHHDQDDHVLVISDLGLLPNLSDCFGNLAGTSPATPAIFESPIARPTLDFTPISPAEGVMIGQKVGSFFAGLHQPEKVRMFERPPYNDSQFLRHDGMLDMVLEAAIRPVKEQLKLFPHLYPKDSVTSAYQHLEDDFKRDTEEVEKVIALGDCWTGALLVGLEDPPAAPQVGIIDWEFASIGRGVNGDMAQLLAHMHLFQIAAAWQGKTESLAAINSIMQGLTAEYRRQNQATNRFWLAKSLSRVPESHPLTVRVMRSAFLAHGAEIINNAFWKGWACDSDLCCGKKCTEKKDCKLIQTMVEKGWWYLYHAKEDELKFVNRQNWEEVQDECILFPLFYGYRQQPDLGDNSKQSSSASTE